MKIPVAVYAAVLFETVRGITLVNTCAIESFLFLANENKPQFFQWLFILIFDSALTLASICNFHKLLVKCRHTFECALSSIHDDA